MICPHCTRTIPEQDIYLMSRRSDGPNVPVGLLRAMGLFVAFLAVLVALVLAHGG